MEDEDGDGLGPLGGAPVSRAAGGGVLAPHLPFLFQPFNPAVTTRQAAEARGQHSTAQQRPQAPPGAFGTQRGESGALPGAFGTQLGENTQLASPGGARHAGRTPHGSDQGAGEQRQLDPTARDPEQALAVGWMADEEDLRAGRVDRRELQRQLWQAEGAWRARQGLPMVPVEPRLPATQAQQRAWPWHTQVRAEREAAHAEYGSHAGDIDLVMGPAITQAMLHHFSLRNTAPGSRAAAAGAALAAITSLDPWEDSLDAEGKPKFAFRLAAEFKRTTAGFDVGECCRGGARMLRTGWQLLNLLPEGEALGWKERWQFLQQAVDRAVFRDHQDHWALVGAGLLAARVCGQRHALLPGQGNRGLHLLEQLQYERQFGQEARVLPPPRRREQLAAEVGLAAQVRLRQWLGIMQRAAAAAQPIDWLEEEARQQEEQYQEEAAWRRRREQWRLARGAELVGLGGEVTEDVLAQARGSGALDEEEAEMERSRHFFRPRRPPEQLDDDGLEAPAGSAAQSAEAQSAGQAAADGGGDVAGSQAPGPRVGTEERGAGGAGGAGGVRRRERGTAPWRRRPPLPPADIEVPMYAPGPGRPALHEALQQCGAQLREREVWERAGARGPHYFKAAVMHVEESVVLDPGNTELLLTLCLLYDIARAVPQPQATSRREGWGRQEAAAAGAASCPARRPAALAPRSLPRRPSRRTGGLAAPVPEAVGGSPAELLRVQCRRQPRDADVRAMRALRAAGRLQGMAGRLEQQEQQEQQQQEQALTDLTEAERPESSGPRDSEQHSGEGAGAARPPAAAAADCAPEHAREALRLASACCQLVTVDPQHLMAAACLLSLAQHEAAVLGPVRVVAALALFLDVARPWQADHAQAGQEVPMEGVHGEDMGEEAGSAAVEQRLAHLLTLQAWELLGRELARAAQATVDAADAVEQARASRAQAEAEAGDAGPREAEQAREQAAKSGLQLDAASQLWDDVCALLEQRLWWRDTHLLPLAPADLAAWVALGADEQQAAGRARALAGVGLAQAALEPLWERARWERRREAVAACDPSINRLARSVREALESCGHGDAASWLKAAAAAVKKAGCWAAASREERGYAVATVLAAAAQRAALARELRQTRERATRFARLYAAAAGAGEPGQQLQQQQEQQEGRGPREQQEQEEESDAEEDAFLLPSGWRPIPFGVAAPDLGLPPTRDLPPAWWAVFPQVRRRRRQGCELSAGAEAGEGCGGKGGMQHTVEKVALAKETARQHLRRLESEGRQLVPTLQAQQQAVLQERAAVEEEHAAAAATAQGDAASSGAGAPPRLLPLALTLSRAFLRDRELLMAAGVQDARLLQHGPNLAFARVRVAGTAPQPDT
eukprot:scaffold11.g3903.t1